MEEIFSPPLIIGQDIVALTVSSSFSSIDELKSLLSDLETLIDAEGDNLALSTFNSLIAISYSIFDINESTYSNTII